MSREKQLAGVLERARHYAEEALAWLVEDGVATAVSVTASSPRPGWLALTVTISLRDGSKQDYELESPVTRLFNNR